MKNILVESDLKRLSELSGIVEEKGEGTKMGVLKEAAAKNKKSAKKKSSSDSIPQSKVITKYDQILLTAPEQPAGFQYDPIFIDRLSFFESKVLPKYIKAILDEDCAWDCNSDLPSRQRETRASESFEDNQEMSLDNPVADDVESIPGMGLAGEVGFYDADLSADDSQETTTPDVEPRFAFKDPSRRPDYGPASGSASGKTQNGLLGPRKAGPKRGDGYGYP